MRDPRLYHRAMLINQAFVTGMYILIGSIVYWYCGQYVSQPSLGSAGPLMKKIAYGLSIPGLFFSVILWCHVSERSVLSDSRFPQSSSWSVSSVDPST